MRIRQGNLVELAQQGQFDVIVHGCNCFNTMGAGIARQIAHVFPQARLVDLATPKGDRFKLGTYSHAIVHALNGRRIVILNAYTQYTFNRQEKVVDIGAIDKVFQRIEKAFAGSHIAYPKIGAGLAGGNWNDIAPVIDARLLGQRHTLVVL